MNAADQYVKAQGQFTLAQLQEPETLAKVLPAGGPLMGREMCPLCEHAPAEPRDNPFRSCRACGYRAP